MEKAYTKISLEEILKELKNDINKHNQLLNAWGKIEHLTMYLYGTIKAALIIADKTDNQAVIAPIRSYR